MKNTYKLKKSEDKNNYWEFTDTQNLVAIIFENKNFKNQEVKLLKEYEASDALILAKILGEMEDHLKKNHYRILYPFSATDEIIAIQEKLGIKGEVMANAMEIAYSTFRKYLANYSFNETHAEKLKQFIIDYAYTLKNNNSRNE